MQIVRKDYRCEQAPGLTTTDRSVEVKVDLSRSAFARTRKQVVVIFAQDIQELHLHQHAVRASRHGHLPLPSALIGECLARSSPNVVR